MQIRFIFALPLPSLVPPPLVPWAAAPVAYPSIHHCFQGQKVKGQPVADVQIAKMPEQVPPDE